jgi:hypothetical protein
MKLRRLEEVTAADLAALPEPRELTPEERAEILKLARESFTAADLQKHTELDEGVPMEQVLEEMEEMARKHETK